MQVDSFLSGTIKATTIKALRSTQWAERVQGLEEVKTMLEGSSKQPPPEQLGLFKAAVAVLSRALQEN